MHVHQRILLQFGGGTPGREMLVDDFVPQFAKRCDNTVGKGNRLSAAQLLAPIVEKAIHIEAGRLCRNRISWILGAQQLL